MTTWAQHVGKFAKENNMKLGKAMQSPKCKAEWKKIKVSGGDLPAAPSVEPAAPSVEPMVGPSVEPMVEPAVASSIAGGRRRKSSKKTKKNRSSKKSRKNYRR